MLYPTQDRPAPRSLILEGHGDNGIVHLVNAYRQQHRIRSRVVLHILVWLCLEFVFESVMLVGSLGKKASATRMEMSRWLYT
jgi:hypothetical protein